MNELLKKLIETGATFATSEPGMPETFLADAVLIGPRLLWFCGVWPANEFAQHWIEFDEAKENRGMIDFFDASGRVFSIAPFERDECEQARWSDWIGEAGLSGRNFVSALKQNSRLQMITVSQSEY